MPIRGSARRFSFGAPALRVRRWMPEWDAGNQSQGRLIGVTRDSSGAPLGFCTVHAFTTADDVKRGETVSDASGNFEIRTPVNAAHYLVAYLAGSPDVAGTSPNTVTPV